MLRLILSVLARCLRPLSTHPQPQYSLPREREPRSRANLLRTPAKLFRSLSHERKSPNRKTTTCRKPRGDEFRCTLAFQTFGWHDEHRIKFLIRIFFTFGRSQPS